MRGFQYALQQSVERQWYGRPTWILAFAPLVPLFSFISKRRRTNSQNDNAVLPVPVIVVGNITVGGTGKTPFVIALCELLKTLGMKPAVISRGYGRDRFPQSGGQASAIDSVDTSLPLAQSSKRYGDEPTLIAMETHCPVVVSSDRKAAAQYAIDHFDCDVVISDDGLQHYCLSRQLEIVLLDAARCTGNDWLLPVGPLREPMSRLNDVDLIVLNGAAINCESTLKTVHSPVEKMVLRPQHWCNVHTGKKCELGQLKLDGAVAIAGIGNPARFQETLGTLGFDGDFAAFPDHHAFSKDDLQMAEGRRLLMTAKDAVKCQAICPEDAWYLVVSAEFSDALLKEKCEALKQHVL